MMIQLLASSKREKLWLYATHGSGSVGIGDVKLERECRHGEGVFVITVTFNRQRGGRPLHKRGKKVAAPSVRLPQIGFAAVTW